MSTELAISKDLLIEIKSRVRQAQQRAALSANAEMIRLYWDIGRLIAARQQEEGWGAGVIPRLAAALKNELPEEKGFSPTNLKRIRSSVRSIHGFSQKGHRLCPFCRLDRLLRSKRESGHSLCPNSTARPDPMARL